MIDNIEKLLYISGTIEFRAVGKEVISITINKLSHYTLMLNLLWLLAPPFMNTCFEVVEMNVGKRIVRRHCYRKRK